MYKKGKSKRRERWKELKLNVEIRRKKFHKNINDEEMDHNNIVKSANY